MLQTTEEDQEVPESKVKREMVQFVDSHEETIRQKVTIILDHFVKNTSKRIDGRGRRMVVVRSRNTAFCFRGNGETDERTRLSYSCLVGFSGTIFHNGRENTESSLNKENGWKTRVFLTDSRILVTES